MFLHILFNNKKTAILIMIAVFLVSLDRFLKVLALSYFKFKPIIITSWFKFSLLINKNIAFSIPLYGTIITLIIITLLLYLIWLFIKNIQEKQTLQAISLLFIILGASSNLIDRFLYQGIVDYLDITKFTIFNLADVIIILGILFFIKININIIKK